MEEKELLRFEGVSAGYEGSQSYVLKNVNLTLQEGKITCLIGESGTGKSTLLKSISQLSGNLNITEGDIYFREKSLKDMTDKERLSLLGNEIGLVFQEPGSSLSPIRKIHKQFYDVLHAHDKSITKKEAREMAALSLESMDFKDPERILDLSPCQISGGMNQRIAIAMAMILKPSLLLLDEPTSALDVTTQSQVIDELIRLRTEKKVSMLMVTHNIGIAAKMADQIAVMYKGEILEQGPKEEVLVHPSHAYTKALLDAVPKIKIS